MMGTIAPRSQPAGIGSPHPALLRQTPAFSRLPHCPPAPIVTMIAHGISISGQRNPGSSAPCDTTHAHVCVQYPRLISACCLMPLLPCILYLSSATALLTIPRPRRHALTAQILVGQSLDGRQLRRPLHLPPQINEPTRRRTRQQARAWKLTMSRLRGDWGGPITS